MKWSEMEPRERDALVADKVMDYHIIIDGWDDNNGGDFGYTPRNGLQAVFLLPHYTTDIAAVWGVVEKLKPTHYFELRIGRFAESARFTAFGPGMKESVAECTSAPEAICLAALKACGVEIES